MYQHHHSKVDVEYLRFLTLQIFACPCSSSDANENLEYQFPTSLYSHIITQNPFITVCSAFTITEDN